MTFKELDNRDSRYYYPVTNEHIQTWQKLLEGISVERAASICSGGEVGFFSILPRVEKELMLIDSSYAALFFAIGKYGLIEKLGAKEARNSIISCAGSLPAELTTMLAEDNEVPIPVNANSRGYEHKLCDLIPVWNSISEEEVSAFVSCRDKVSFLHGDITGLAEFGPFDLLYLSNALDYGNFPEGRFLAEKIVRPGGYVLFSRLSSGNPSYTFWETISSACPTRAERDYGMNWYYNLCKLPE